MHISLSIKSLQITITQACSFNPKYKPCQQETDYHEQRQYRQDDPFYTDISITQRITLHW